MTWAVDVATTKRGWYARSSVHLGQGLKNFVRRRSWGENNVSITCETHDTVHIQFVRHISLAMHEVDRSVSSDIFAVKVK